MLENIFCRKGSEDSTHGASEIHSNIQVISLGDLEDKSQKMDCELPDLVGLTKLKRIHLWNCSGPKALPKVHNQLRTIDIRGNPQIETIQSLPTQIESLHLESCSNLSTIITIPENLSSLKNLRIIDCPRIPEDILGKLLSRSPNLETLDLSGNPHVTNDLLLRIDERASLRRLELNRCEKLESLTAIPPYLTRLGLSHSVNLVSLPDSFEFHNLDHVDLTFTRSLRKIPKFPLACRTLKLFGSGVLSPPRSEHGISPEENVMQATREHFSEIDQVGYGEVKRAKLLFLGNGRAGKSYLAVRLYCQMNQSPLNDACPYWRYTQDSTHGIQFLDIKDYQAGKKGFKRKCDLHFWDFGGQEIYHSTHRHFVRNGSVFILVWNPNQDGQSQATDRFNHIDSLQPPSYWFDYLHSECPYENPMVAVVCSDHREPGQKTDAVQEQQLKEKYRKQFFDQISPKDAERLSNGNSFFMINSKDGTGEIKELMEWIASKVGDVIEAQGSQVRLYWDAAQQMLSPVLREAYQTDPADISSPEAHAEQSRWEYARFQDELKSYIQGRFSSTDSPRYEKLKAIWDDGRLLDDCTSRNDLVSKHQRPWRIDSTLRFLTHSGWIYWSPELYQARVIINQAWALQHVYTALDRNYAKLLSNMNGKFTLEELQNLARWDQEMDQSDRELLLSFMESVGVCFPIARRWYESYGKETQYICPTYLPDSKQAIEGFEAEAKQKQISLKEHPIERPADAPKIHRGTWSAILRDVAKNFGEDAEYYNNAVILNVRWSRSGTEIDPNGKNQKVLVKWVPQGGSHAQGPAMLIGGELIIVAGQDAQEELVGGMKGLLMRHLPKNEGERPKSQDNFAEGLQRGTLPKKTVFLSYKWDPVENNYDSLEPEHKDYEDRYEEAVDAIEKGLEPYTGNDGPVVVLRDKRSMKPSDYIYEYSSKIKAPEVDLVVLVLSDRYLKSWWCMMELSWLLGNFDESRKNLKESVLVVKHSSVKQANYVKDALTFWSDERDETSKHVKLNRDPSPASFPTELYSHKINWRPCIEEFIYILTEKVSKLEGAPGLNEYWSSEKEQEILSWIKNKLGIA